MKGNPKSQWTDVTLSTVREQRKQFKLRPQLVLAVRALNWAPQFMASHSVVKRMRALAALRAVALVVSACAFTSGASPFPVNRACSSPDAKQHKFCDVSATLDARVGDLVSQLTLAEKVSLLTARHSSPVERLGIP